MGSIGFMGSLMNAAHSISPLLARLLIASVWQGLLLTAGVALVLHATHGISPNVRTRVWTAVMVVVLLLPVLALLLPKAQASTHAELHLATQWSMGLLALWALSALWRGSRLAASAVRLWRLARHARPVMVSGKVASLLGGPRRALLCVSDELNRPGLVGFFAPRVLLPVGLLETLAPEELEHVVLHEMEHLRRGDDWWNLLQQISLVILPLNPALVWLDRRLCRERELACDDGVLAATRARKAYAACLVKLAEESLLRKGLALALGALGAAAKSGARRSELVCRVRRILAGPEQVATVTRLRFAVGTLAVAVLAAAGLLARSPELVSFDGSGESTPTMAQTAEPQVYEHLPAMGRMVTASAVVRTNTAEPVMTDAVFSKPGSMRSRSVAATAVRRRRTPAQGLRAKHMVSPVNPWSAVTGNAVAPVSRTWTALPVRAAVEEPFPAATVPALAQKTAPGVTSADPMAARFVVTEFQVSQPVFAAVPVRGGWLIFQL